MGNTKNIIDINGKRYDAVSGVFLGHSAEALKPKPPIHSVRHAAPHGGTIDGFRRVSRDATQTPILSKPAKPLPVIQPIAEKKPRQHGISLQAHSPQRATTLMRTAVKKPEIHAPETIKAQTRTDLLAKAPAAPLIQPKIGVSGVNPLRRDRAERMVRNPAVSRYGSAVPAPEPTVYNIAKPDLAVARPVITGQARSDRSDHTARTYTRPLIRPAGQHFRSNEHSDTDSHTGQKHEDDNDIFMQALAEARSHEQTYDGPAHRTKRRYRRISMTGISLVALVGLFFLICQNTSAISLKIASYRSGVHVTLPSRQPNGFKLGYLDYQPGNVTANFTSPSDGRQYNIVQKASDWDSQALLSNFVSSVGSAYKTYQRAGRTVYVLGNDTATWVDSGVWYTVDGNASLSPGQLLDLAGSM